jgi:uncharacterized protein (TIGR03437 family)
MIEIIPHSNTRRGLAESKWHRVCGILTLLLPVAMAQAAPALNVVISNETAPPGDTVQIKISLDKAAVLSLGELAFDLDPTVFGPVTGIAVLSAAGDGCGYAMINGSHLDIHLASPSATLGSTAGMPLVVIAVQILSTAVPGARATINADPTRSQWIGPPVTVYSVAVTPGTVTVGGALSVSAVNPVSNLAAGAVVRIQGGGFTSSTTVDIAAVNVASVQNVGPQEIDVTLAGPADLGGKRITVSNPGGSPVDFFAAPPAQPLSTLGGGAPSGNLDGALPLFPVASYTAGYSDQLKPGFNFGRVALANPNPSPVDVLLEGLDSQSVLRQATVTIPAGGAYDNDFASLIGTGTWVQASATAPLRMIELISDTSTSHPAGYYETAPLSPAGATLPLAVAVGPNTETRFNWVTGTAPPQSQTFTLAGSPQGESVSFTASSSTTSGGNWLSVTPASGTAPSVLTVTANPTGLAAGVYYGSITVTPLATRFHSAGARVSIRVALTATSAPLVNHIIQRASNNLLITPDMLPGQFTVNTSTDSGGNWLSATPLSGTTPTQLQLTTAPGNLGPGVYAGTVAVNGSGGNTVVLESTLTVYGGVQLITSRYPVFALGPDGSPSAPQTVPVDVWCSAVPCSLVGMPQNLTWTATASTHSGGNWLHVVSSGFGVTISVDSPQPPLPGVYTGVVTVTSDQAAPAQIPVALNVWTGPVPALFVDPPTLSLTSAPFASPIPGEGIICASTGSLNVQQKAKATTSSGGAWLAVTANPDVTNLCGITLSLDASHLDSGVYQGDVTISVPGQSVDVPVTLTIPPPLNNCCAQPLLGSFVNAASGIQGAIAAGEIITIHGIELNYFGPNTTFTLDSNGRVPTSLGKAEVLINGKPSPMLYTSPWQINAIVPYEVAGLTAATVQVLFNGTSNVWSVPVAPAAPAIFTLDATGSGPAAVLNQDNSVNGPAQPAVRGSVIQIFATGLPVTGAVTGSVTPAAAPGSTDPVSVAIGGVTASIQYAGPAPGEIAGLIQVNAVVPDNAPTGTAIPIVLSVSPPQGPLQPIIYASQLGATVAVQ